MPAAGIEKVFGWIKQWGGLRQLVPNIKIPSDGSLKMGNF